MKTFGALRANDTVDLTVEWGQVHALLGENGAGKSTLMNVVYGLLRADSGEMRFDGGQVQVRSPQDAIRLGIGMVHQHFMLIPPLTVADNVILGQETARAAGVIDARASRRTVHELSRRYGLQVDPDARVRDLSVGVQQRVEILKALYRGARLLILDEPTSVLTPQETGGLFEIVRGLTAAGSAVIFITHKLGEVMAIADRITVMRRGKVVASTTPAESSQADLARLMVGRPVLLRVEKGPAKPGKPLLQVQDLSVLDDRRQVAVDGLSLEVREGEILGLAGVEGNGQVELVEAIAGLRPTRSGRVVLCEGQVTAASPRRRLRGGLGHIPADRHRMGVILELPISDNLVLADFDRPPFAKGIVRLLDQVRDHAAQLIRSFDVRAAGPQQLAGALSGGNQQKVVVARELSNGPRVLMAAQPTRGVDVGSIEFIHRQIVEQRDAGLAVLLVSSELDEVLSLADRVAVIYRGRIAAVLEAGDIDRDRIGLLMAGGQAGEVPAASAGG
ncbi:MAG: ABC transporter ATP-binding protein [Candidatus Dormibacteraeota bacterium]|nr:ABC transporter ATP-binding protein [Candidatus Dormibacteraeota bacterium]